MKNIQKSHKDICRYTVCINVFLYICRLAGKIDKEIRRGSLRYGYGATEKVREPKTRAIKGQGQEGKCADQSL